MRVTVWESRSGEYIETDEATSLPLDATEDRYLGLVNGKRLGEQGTKWSVTIMQERLFPHAPCPRSCSLKDSKYPYVTGQQRLGPFTCHLFVYSNQHQDARRLQCLFECYFYVHIITRSKRPCISSSCFACPSGTWRRAGSNDLAPSTKSNSTARARTSVLTVSSHVTILMHIPALTCAASLARVFGYFLCRLLVGFPFSLSLSFAFHLTF
jgi:hypothetical protein